MYLQIQLSAKMLLVLSFGLNFHSNLATNQKNGLLLNGKFQMNFI